METHEDQPKLLAKIRKLTDLIQGIRAKFALPKANQKRFDTYGGALSLQKAKEDRRVLQGKLDPIRLIATGVSCRDCRHFADLDRPRCFFNWNTRNSNCGWPTPVARGPLFCGPEARWFEPHRLVETDCGGLMCHDPKCVSCFKREYPHA